MYEHLRNDFALKLSTLFSQADIEKICITLDSVSKDYEIAEKSTALVVYEGNFPKEAEIYLQSKRLEGLSPNSEKLYRNRLQIFFETLQKRPEVVTTRDIRNFLTEYQARSKVSNRTLDKFRQIINGFYEWCVNEDYQEKNPCKNIKEIKYEVVPRKALTRMELEKLRRACTTKMEIAMVDTLYSTGCRVSEFVNMKKSDIIPEEKAIHIVGKGNKHNYCYFNTNAQISLGEYMEERTDDSDYLFIGVRSHNKMDTREVEKIIKRLGRKVGLDITPHVLRHTFATLALQNGATLTQVQKMLGHSKADTTLIYAEISREEIRLSHLKFVS